MTVLFTEGFSHYRIGGNGITDAQAKNWLPIVFGESGRTVESASPRFPGSRYVRITTAVFGAFIGTWTTRAFPAQTELAVGMAFQVDADNDTTGFNVGSMGVRIGATFVRLLGPSGTLLNLPHPGSGTIWNHYELHVVVHPSAGSATLWLNGVEVGSFTGINTGSTAVSAVQVQRFVTGPNFQFTDIHVATEPLGDCRVITQWPDGDGHHTDLTPEPSADNYTRVNTTTLNDSTYNHSDTLGDLDTYTYPALPAAADYSVFAVAPAMRAQKSDAGTVSGRVVNRVDGTDFTGPDLVLASTAWQWFPHIWSENPDTGLPWDTADVDAAEAGFEVR